MQKIFVVVDGLAGMREQTVRQLQGASPGAEVIEAASGEAALQLLEERRLAPSMLFTALELPGMTGLELLGEIRHRRWLERVPVAMLSEPVSDRQVVSSYRLGACVFLTQPVRARELQEAVRDFGRAAVQMNAASVVGTTPPQHRASAA